MSLTVIFPETSDDAISDGLRDLTAAIERIDPDGDYGYGLGGQHGYGANFENDTFMMHRFCWCDRDDCLWCAGCDCPSDAYHYFVDDKEVAYRGWMDFYMRHVYGMTDTEMKEKGVKSWDLRPRDYERKSTEANSRRSTRHDAVCDYCTGTGIFRCDAVLPGKGAPNFWHKPSGFRVYWYKWIGRDNEIEGSAGANFKNILAECFDSLSTAHSEKGEG